MIVKYESRRSKTMMKPFLIYLFGIDGAGKTTQVVLIMKKLRKKGLKVRYVWLRWVAFLSVPFYLLCRLMGFTEWKTLTRNGQKFRYTVHYFHRSSAVGSLWCLLYSIDLVIFNLIKVRIPLLLGYTIISDRYILDAMVDMMYETSKDLLNSPIAKILLSQLPPNSIMALIDVDETTAYARKKDIPSPDFVAKRREIYLTIAKKYGIPTVDGTKPIRAVYDEIINTLLPHGIFD